MGLIDMFRRKEVAGSSDAWPSSVTAVRVLYVEDDATDQFIVTEMLSELGDNAFVVTCARTYAEGVRAIRNQEFDVYLLDFQLGERSGLDLLHEELDDGAKGPAILLTGSGDREVDLEAMRRGASGYILKGEFDALGLERAIRYAMRAHQVRQEAARGAGASQEATVASFIGARGGVGTSTTAVNVAAAAASSGRRVILLDLRTQYGSAAEQLGLEPEATMGQLCRLAESEIDGAVLRRHLTSHECGVKLLAAPICVEECGTLAPETAAAILRAARSECDLLVVDLPCGFGEANEEAVRMSDHIGVVLDRESTSIRAAALTLQWLATCDARGRAGAVLIDRSNLPSVASSSNIVAYLDTDLLAFVAASPDTAAEAVTRGTPVALGRPAHFVAEAMSKLADSLGRRDSQHARAPMQEKAIFAG